MIEFIEYENQERGPMFQDVQEDQFFIDDNGRLCQKNTSTQYNVISESDGTPYCCQISSMQLGHKIKKILPKISKVRFD